MRVGPAATRHTSNWWRRQDVTSTRAQEACGVAASVRRVATEPSSRMHSSPPECAPGTTLGWVQGATPHRGPSLTSVVCLSVSAVLRWCPVAPRVGGPSAVRWSCETLCSGRPLQGQPRQVEWPPPLLVHHTSLTGDQCVPGGQWCTRSHPWRTVEPPSVEVVRDTVQRSSTSRPASPVGVVTTAPGASHLTRRYPRRRGKRVVRVVTTLRLDRPSSGPGRREPVRRPSASRPGFTDGSERTTPSALRLTCKYPRVL